MVCAGVRMSLLAALATSCSTSSERPADGCERWVAAIVASDPAFGGGLFSFQRIVLDWRWRRVGDASVRDELVPQLVRDGDRDAASLVRHLAPAPDPEVLAFWRSDAGNALALAELRALAGSAHAGTSGEFLREFTALASDAGRVGEAAQAELRQGYAALARGETVSPHRFAVTVAAANLQAEHAPAIAAFHASPAGQRWLDVRCAAFRAAQPQFGRFVDALAARGLLRHLYDELDLTLPRAIFDEPDPGRDR